MRSVYLSRSNAGDAESYKAVKSVLEKMDVKIIEHTGGPYDASLVTSASCLIIIPPRRINSSSYADIISRESIGKGQNDQIDAFIKCRNGNSNCILVAKSVRPYREEIDFGRFLFKSSVEKNWTDSFASITCEGTIRDVDYFFDKKKVVKPIKGEPVDLDLDLDAYTVEEKQPVQETSTYESLSNALRKGSGIVSRGNKWEPVTLESSISPEDEIELYKLYTADDAISMSILILKSKIRKSLVKVSAETTRPILALAA